MKPPIYVLPHGIEVIGEHKPNAKFPYWRVRIRPHRFFPDGEVRSNGVSVSRNRVLLAAKLGRALTRDDIAHHVDENKEHDTMVNIELLTPAEHNRHHKSGSKHTADAKERIASSMKRAIAEGRHPPPPRPDWTGKKHRPESRQRISETRKARIAAGLIARQTPPSCKGRKLSDATKERIRQAKLDYWKRKKGSPQ